MARFSLFAVVFVGGFVAGLLYQISILERNELSSPKRISNSTIIENTYPLSLPQEALTSFCSFLAVNKEELQEADIDALKGYFLEGVLDGIIEYAQKKAASVSEATSQLSIYRKAYKAGQLQARDMFSHFIDLNLVLEAWGWRYHEGVIGTFERSGDVTLFLSEIGKNVLLPTQAGELVLKTGRPLNGWISPLTKESELLSRYSVFGDRIFLILENDKR